MGVDLYLEERQIKEIVESGYCPVTHKPYHKTYKEWLTENDGDNLSIALGFGPVNKISKISNEKIIDGNLILLKTSYKEICSMLEEIAFKWNSRIDFRNLFKLKDCTNLVWYGLYDNKSLSYVAFCAIDEHHLIDHKKEIIYAMELFAKSGNNYGIKLTNMVIQHYAKFVNVGYLNPEYFAFVVNPTQTVSLIAHYLKHFQVKDGWKIVPIENKFWKSVEFRKEFK